jgi:cytochrome c biogenesis protein
MQKIYPDQILKKLSNIQLAISLLLIIGIVVAIGTVVEQDQNLSFYKQNYPEINPILGFIDWKLLLLFNFDHIYTSYWFNVLLFIFGFSLLSCTLSVQLPVLIRMRRWKFYTNIKKTNCIGKILPKNCVNSLIYQLHLSCYISFRQGQKIYAYSGLLGRFGPIVVHASLILLLIGSTIGAFFGHTSQEIIPRGEIFHAQNVIKLGNLSLIPQSIAWRVNDFWITYTKDFKTNQFYSDLSLIDNLGNEKKRKTIFVNEPFIYRTLTFYQTDWDIVGLKFAFKNDKVTQLPLNKITKIGQKFWFGSIDLFNSDLSKSTFSILINDLRGNLYIYNSQGKLLQECKLGQTIFLEPNKSIQLLEFLTSTGLQIKTDPGIRIVFLAFFLLMVSTYTSFISYSQIWGVDTNSVLTLAGTSNRAILFFQEEFRKLKANSLF